MCKLFINPAPHLWVSRAHSLRIDGMVTSVRIEDAFWRVLEEVAERDGMNLPQMITRLYHESIDAGHDLGNFTSFLRVCAMRYPPTPGWQSHPWTRKAFWRASPPAAHLTAGLAKPPTNPFVLRESSS